MHLNFAKEICPGWPLILFFLLFNATNGDKLSVDRKKSVDNNKKGKSEDKSSANREKLANNNTISKSKNKFGVNREKLANDNNGDPNNEPIANMESLVREKNINQNSNPSIQE